MLFSKMDKNDTDRSPRVLGVRKNMFFEKMFFIFFENVKNGFQHDPQGTLSNLMHETLFFNEKPDFI